MQLPIAHCGLRSVSWSNWGETWKASTRHSISWPLGGGGGSMCSGLVMHEAGKSVVILEKTGMVGGARARSGGVMWIPNNFRVINRSRKS